MGAFDDYMAGTYKPEEQKQPIPEPIELGTYSQNDLVDDKYFDTVKNYMETRFGIDEFRGDDKEEIVNKFLNNMRGFSGGNSVRAVGEVAFLNSLEDDSEELATVGKAYELFENMAGVFSRETTAGEKLEAVGDYARTTLVDPVNLVGFGIGKLFTGVGSKSAAKLAQQAAIKSYRQQIQKGITEEIAKEAADKIFTQTFKKVSKDNAAKAVAKKEARDKIPDTIKNRLKSNAKEITANMAVEMAVNVGSAYAYEKGLVRTGVQEEVNKINLGLAGVGTMVIGGVRFGTVALQKNKNALAQPDIDVQPPKPLDISESMDMFTLEDISKITDTKLKEAAQKRNAARLEFTEPLREKAKRGVELSDLDTDFFIKFLLGDDEAGIKGMAQILAEQGHVYIKRTPEDSVSNYISDVLKKSDPKITKKFIKDFTKATGFKMVELDKKVGKRKINMENFADLFAKKISDQGKLLNAVSQVRKKLGITREQAENIKVSEAAAALLNLDNRLNVKNPKELSWAGKLNQSVVDAQRKVIRLLVTAPSTSYLNLVGYRAAMLANTASDVALSLSYLGTYGLNKMFNYGDPADALRIAKQLAYSQVQRAKNLMDTEMTYDAYMSIAQKNPEALKQLTFAMNGGIEVDDALKKAFGGEVDYSKSLLSLQADKGIDILQTINFVHGQDILTKSQEFVYQLDKYLRIGFDKNWNEFFTDPNAAKLMRDPKYVTALSKSVYETQKATFSLSYKDAGTIPKMIEELRDVPGFGLLVPFGRFFNNTVALMSDGIGATALMQGLGVKTGTERSLRENTMRGFVGLGALVSLTQSETLNRELGLSWHQQIDKETGAVKDVKYDFPLSHFKGLGRFFSYIVEGENMPEDERNDILDTVGIGQLTRQLDDFAEGFTDNFGSTIFNFETTTADGRVNPEGVQGDRIRKELLATTLGRVASQVASGSTRFLDPINTAVGLARGSDFKMVNRKEGSETLNNSLRYMDQIIAVAMGEDISEEKFNATTGKISLDAAKQLGYREVEMSDTKKVMNIIGMPNYLANIRTKDAKADNRYNQLFHDIIERRSSELLRSDRFREGDDRSREPILSWRQGLVRDMLSDAKSTTIAIMERGVYDTDDTTFAKMIKIGSKYSWDKIDRNLAALSKKTGEDLEFKNLDSQQLDTLEAYLEYEKYIRKRRKN